MKFGFRTPNFKSRIKAKTSVKRKLRAKTRLPKGTGAITNPSRYIKSKAYHKTTVPLESVLRDTKSKTRTSKSNRTIKSNDASRLVTKLINVAAFGASDESAYSKENMDAVLAEIESQPSMLKSAIVNYWLGVAWRNYTSWHIRGDERKPYLEKSIYYFNKSFEAGKNENIPVKLPDRETSDAFAIDLIKPVSDAADIYVNEKLVRDLETAEKLLIFIWNKSDDYEPIFCSLAELYYKKEKYEKCLKVALATHKRAVQSDFWKSDPPPAPMNIAGKALRALVRAEKRKGNTEKAIEYGKRAIELGVASENDKKILKKILRAN